MTNIFRSFYAKLSFIFLFLILILGMTTLFIAFSSTGRLSDEVEQLLNREYAKSISTELEPFVEKGFSEKKIKSSIHYMMVLNPMVEIYIINSKGNILSYFAAPGDLVIQKKININPLIKFIKSEGMEPVLGDDPRTKDRVKPFSAAPLKMGNENGFVYVILRGQSYDRYLDMVRNNYYFRSVLITFLFALLITLFAGFSLFFFLTRRLKKLSVAVTTFQQGNYNHRIKIKGSDELASLSQAFNEMAASIAKSVDELHHSEKQRSDLITNISHDLRSPLTSIRGHLETILLKKQKLTDEEGREYIKLGLRNISSLQKLVEELFDLAKLESKQVKVIKEPFNLAELAQDIILKLKPQTEAFGISIIMHHDDKLMNINADIGMIERVINNLLENALTYTPEGGKIELTLKENNKNIQIIVSDTGSGIDVDDLPHIFERFYRADKSRNRGKPGTGLGLAIVREIIELHEGTIQVQSSPGSGAIFYVNLPFYT
jgi:signal transduction histidine kinase